MSFRTDFLMKATLLFVSILSVSVLSGQVFNKGISNGLSYVEFDDRHITETAHLQMDQIRFIDENGQSSQYQLLENNLISGKLKEQYPNHRSFDIQSMNGIDAYGKMVVSPTGIYGLFQHPNGMVLISPSENKGSYRIEKNWKIDPALRHNVLCQVKDPTNEPQNPHALTKELLVTNGEILKEFDMAIMVTGEYYEVNGNNDAEVMSWVMMNVESANFIFEKDLSSTFVLDDRVVLYRDKNLDPFVPNPDPDVDDRVRLASLVASQVFNINEYDIGHVLSNSSASDDFSGGGLAGLRALCSESINSEGGHRKAGGWSGNFSSQTASFIETFAHELGHMFGAQHTFNGTDGSCTDAISRTNAYEIGSGSTIMSYQGTCGSEFNIPREFEDVEFWYFHVASLYEMVSHLNDVDCHATLSHPNNVPSLNINPCGLTEYILPMNTPFILTAEANDADNDNLTYCWEQYDEDGLDTPTQGFIGTQAALSAIAPLFRSYPPVSTPMRQIPSPKSILNGGDVFEVLPRTSRDINMRLTVRDNANNGGAIAIDDVLLQVAQQGPLLPLRPSANQNVNTGEDLLVTWNPNGTEDMCNEVDIYMSLDGGESFDIQLASSVPYTDREANVNIPVGLLSTDNARVKIQCGDNACFAFFNYTAEFNLISSCEGDLHNTCSATDFIEAASGSSELNIDASPIFISNLEDIVINVQPDDPVTTVARNKLDGTCEIMKFDSGNNVRIPTTTFEFYVSSSGSYQITSDNIDGSFKIMNLYIADEYDANDPCASRVGGNGRESSTNPGTTSTSAGNSFSADLESCTRYILTSGIFSNPIEYNLIVSGPGDMVEAITPNATYLYTYAAVSNATELIVAINDMADFRSLSEGDYAVYGLQHSDDTDPISWIGQNINLLYNDCVNPSENSIAVTVLPDPSICDYQNAGPYYVNNCVDAFALCNIEEGLFVSSCTPPVSAHDDFCNPEPLCIGDALADNMTWYSFVAGSESFLDITVNLGECTEGVGIEAGLYSDCPCDGGFCLVAEEDGGAQLNLVLANVVNGRTYYLWIDGIEGAQCYYDIVFNSFTPFTLETPDDLNINVPSENTLDENIFCLDNDVVEMIINVDSYSDLDTEGSISYDWTFEIISGADPGVDAFFSTSVPDVNFLFQEEGSYRVCLDGAFATCDEWNDDGPCYDFTIVNSCDDAMVEICDNGIDDDGDGLADCDDPDLQMDCCCLDPEALSISGPTMICEGDVATLTAEGVFESYLWSTGEETQSIEVTDSDFYIVVATDSCGNQNENAVQVSFFDGPFEEMLEFEICPGQEIQINDETYTDPGDYVQNLTTINGCDSILNINLFLGPIVETLISEQICDGDSIVINNEVYNAAGQYEQLLQTVNGCDSILTIELTSLPNASGLIDESICNGGSIEINGEIYNDSGSYTQNLTAQNGCDSTLNITINITPTVGQDTIVTICEGSSTEINGEVYDTPGQYNQTLVSQAGCDSILTIAIMIDDVVEEQISEDICDGSSVEINGEIYDEAGTYTQNLQSQTGCDSVLTIMITLVNAMEGTLVESICEGDEIEINGETYSDAGSYTQNLTAQNGCDSILNITINLLDVLEENIDETICDGSSVEINGETYDTAGSFVQNLISQSGCDSILNITIVVVDIIEENITEAICDGSSVEINGETYDAAGNFTQNLLSQAGCDSILNIEILVNDVFEGDIDASICQGGTIEINGEIYDMEGDYQQSLTTQAGCDSLLNIVIEELASDTTTLTENICQGEEVVVNGTSYSVAGSYEELTTNSNGCDSLIILELAVSDAFTEITDFRICEGDTLNVNDELYFSSGTYEQFLSTISGCDSVLIINVELDESFAVTENYVIFPGDIITVNGQDYDAAGNYVQDFTTGQGCDSTVFINIKEVQSLVYYNLDDCLAWANTDNNLYTEFTAEYPTTLDCGTIESSILYRQNPNVNLHSCTPGLDGTAAMCVGSLDTCSYDKDSDKPIVFDMTVVPDVGSTITINSIEFYQKAPDTFEWVQGNTGENNYPTLYGLRILLNGDEVFFQDSMPTTLDWNLESFVFDDIAINSTSDIRVEMMGYCLIDNGSFVSAWDIENVNVLGSCEIDNDDLNISGRTMTADKRYVNNAEIKIEGPFFEHSCMTNEFGKYDFEDILIDYFLVIEPYKNDDCLNGVSTLDLVRIQRHILGLDHFDNHYQYIAADIDHNNGINAIDLIELRKLILGVYDEFPRNTSWRFFDQNQVFNITSPWYYQENIVLGPNSNPQTALDFYGVKIGDVDGTAVTTRAKEKHQLIYDAISNDVNTTQIDFYSESVDQLAGIQLSIEFEDAKITKVISGAFDLNPSVYALKDGNLKISYVNSNLQNIESNDVLFSIIVDNKNVEATLSAVLSNESYFGDELEIKEVVLSERNASLTGNSLGLSIAPNPFATSTFLSFDNDEQRSVDLTISDINGKLVYSKTYELEKGSKQIEILSNDLPLSGTYILNLASEDFRMTERIVHIK